MRPAAVEEEPAGLLYEPGFVTPDEESTLRALVEDMEFGEVQMRGRTARRTVRHFGWDYGYETLSLAPAEALPDGLVWLRDRGAALAAVAPDRLVECLVTRYPAGATIGWHRDAPLFGSRVVGVSLLAGCRMRFRRTVGGVPQNYELSLAPRSAYVLAGAARWSWQHSIPPVPALRYSITFRSLRSERS